MIPRFVSVSTAGMTCPSTATLGTEEDQQQDQGHHRRRWPTTSSEEQQCQPHRRKRIEEGSSSARISSRNNHIVVGGTADRSSTSTQRIKRIFDVGGTADKAHPRRSRGARGSASSEERRRGLLPPQIPGGSISCYYNFSSLQSRIVRVWGWQSLDLFEYR